MAGRTEAFLGLGKRHQGVTAEFRHYVSSITVPKRVGRCALAEGADDQHQALCAPLAAVAQLELAALAGWDSVIVAFQSL